MASKSLDDLKAEEKIIVLQFRGAAAGALSLLFGGALLFHLIEKWSWLNSIYFCTVSLTTVGYGDITPQTNLGKLVDIFYVLIGIGIIAFFANILIKRIVVRRELKNHPDNQTKQKS